MGRVFLDVVLPVALVAIGCGVCVRCQAGRSHLCARRTETGIVHMDGAMASRMVASGANSSGSTGAKGMAFKSLDGAASSQLRPCAIDAANGTGRRARGSILCS